MALHINLFVTLLLLPSILFVLGSSASTKDIDYSDTYDESHTKTEGSESPQAKRKWSSDRMGVWGKRFQTDGSSDYDVPEAYKRKWTSGNMGMWGKRSQADPRKRKWDSKSMGLWGRKRSLMKNGDYYGEYDDSDGDVVVVDKRRWSPSGATAWDKRLDSAINQIRSQKSKWASGSMGMWG